MVVCGPGVVMVDRRRERHRGARGRKRSAGSACRRRGIRRVPRRRVAADVSERGRRDTADWVEEVASWSLLVLSGIDYDRELRR